MKTVLYVHHIKRYGDMLDKYTVLYFLLVVVENQYSCEVDSIIRNNDVYGDILTGLGLNCTKHGLIKFSNSSCYCGQYQTYYTNDTGETKCYGGIGDELGNHYLCIIKQKI